MDFDSDAEDELSSLQPDEAAGFVEPDPYVSETAREIEEIQVVSETVETQPAMEIKTPSPTPLSVVDVAENFSEYDDHDDLVVSEVTMASMESQTLEALQIVFGSFFSAQIPSYQSIANKMKKIAIWIRYTWLDLR